jgi:transposase
MAYIIGNRGQITFFPPSIDEYIGPEDPVRVYDAFVEALNFEELGITIQGNKAGAHEYYPKAMVKLIIYGYSYGNRSSRRLERACHHNLSFIWLVSGLKPDYRTIARFRSENKKAIKEILKQCVKLCIKLDLIEGNTLFIDGSKFRANASIKNTWTDEKCQEYLEKISKNIERLVDEAERIDWEEEEKESLVKIKKELMDQEKLQATIQEVAKTLKETGKSSINTVDEDCVKAKGRQGTHASYNAQMAVDEKHGLIVSSDAVSQNNDLNQLHHQLKQASEAIGKKPDVACTDAGYFSLEDIKQVEEAIKVVMPTQKQAQKEKDIHAVKPFGKEQFQYDATKDEYVCPEGKRLPYKGIAFSHPRKRAYKADGKDCRECAHFGVCTPSREGRRIVRLSEEPLKERLEAIYHSPEGQEIYRLRKQKVELPFGHMKRNLGAGQFLLRGRRGVNAELSLLSTCFNIARMISLVGISALIPKLQGM